MTTSFLLSAAQFPTMRDDDDGGGGEGGGGGGGGGVMADLALSASHSPPHSPSHSRESSEASSTSSPTATTFSTRSHSRWPSSASSVATTPDSPVNVTKSALHDLVEDPAEREEDPWHGQNGYFDEHDDNAIEELCICDTPFCQHREINTSAPASSPVSPEWSPGDDTVEDDMSPAQQPSMKRRQSAQLPGSSITQRLSRHMPSISKRWYGRQRNISETPSIRSAPASRAASIRVDSLSPSRDVSSDFRTSITPTIISTARISDEDVISVKPSRASAITCSQSTIEDPIDRDELACTPLLPPMMNERQRGLSQEVQSPLQSPSVAGPGSTFSASSTPALTPVVPNMPTPPLSSKPSMTSMHGLRHGHLLPVSDIPSMPISEEEDPWAVKLGHANFHIYPEPYYPEICTAQTVKRLLEDWEAARVEFLRQAAHVAEHHGPTSHILKLTEEKWTDIDAEWRSNHESATNEARAMGENPSLQSLAETVPTPRIPSLGVSQQQGKFPKIGDAEIVGPMVQYARVRQQPPRRTSFLRVLTDPVSLFGRVYSGARNK